METKLMLAAILSLPAFLGLAAWLFKIELAASLAEKFHTDAEAKRKAVAENSSRTKRLLGALFLAPYAVLGNWSTRFEDRHLRAGVRVMLSCYLTGLLCVLVAMLLYVGFIVVVAVAGIMVMIWITGAILKGALGLEGSPSSRPASRTSAGFLGAVAAGGKSRRREGLFGEYVEHTDRHGRVVGRSQVREGLTGEYVEHTDATGRRVGRTDHREGFFGDYEEHRDSEGAVVGRSTQREGLLGPYAEHRDRDGHVIGESREEEGLFGDETRHRPRD